MDKMNIQKALARRLEHLREAVSEAEGRPVSDADFAKRYLSFSGTTFSRIKSETEVYAGSLDNIAEKVTQAEEDVAERLADLKRSVTTESVFQPTKLACATHTAIRRARANKDRRVVVVLARTGEGKSTIGEALAARGAIYIEGRQSWKKSYKAFCADVARAAGRPLKVKAYTEHDAEERMLQALRSRDAILYIDEANTLGPESANAIKLIVNATGTVVVIAAVPGAWDKLCDGAVDEVEQLLNRCQPVLRSKGQTVEDAKLFLASSGLNEADISRCAKMAADAANEFGGVKTIVSLVADLKLQDQPSVEDVETFLKFHSKNTALSGIQKGVAQCQRKR